MGDITMCRRWAVVFDHDGSPLDGCIFNHKPAAVKALKAQPNNERLRIERVCILSDAVVEELLKRDGTS